MIDRLNDKLEDQATDLYSQEYVEKYRANDLKALENLNSMFVKSFLAETFRDLIAKRNNDKEKIRILDIGCGTGRFFHCFNNNAIITGLDVSIDMLAEAKKPVKINETAIPELELINDKLTPTFVKERKCGFDLIYSVGVYGDHAKYSKDLFESCRAMLKPNGVALIDITDIETVGIARQKKWYGSFLKILLQLKPMQNLFPILSPRLGKYVNSQTIFSYCSQHSNVKSVAMEINNENWSGKKHFVYLQKNEEEP